MVGSSALTWPDDRTQPLEIAFVLGADDLGEECLDHLQRGLHAWVSNDCSRAQEAEAMIGPGVAGERRAARTRSLALDVGLVRSWSGLISLPLARIS